MEGGREGGRRGREGWRMGCPTYQSLSASVNSTPPPSQWTHACFRNPRREPARKGWRERSWEREACSFFGSRVA